MKLLKFSIVLLAISILLSGCVEENTDLLRHQQLQADLQQMLDSALLQYKEKVPEYPGGIALNVLYGEESFFVSSGMGTSVTNQIHFRAASCTKTFTATAILLLHQQGKLNINDHITDNITGTSDPYIRDIQDYNIPHKESITILDLLRHRAGIFDVSNDLIPDTISADLPYKGSSYIDYIMASEPLHTFTFDELVKVVADTRLSYFTPGNAYHYSNTGYSILGKIIERVSKRSYQNFLMENIIIPMGMTNSTMPVSGDDREIPPPYASGYVLFDNQQYDVTQSNISANVAEGNLITTPGDLSRFLAKLLSGQGVLNYHTVNTLMMNYLPTGNNGAGGYGCGLSYTNHLGYGHNGAHEGYLSIMAYDPVTDFSVVAFTNTWDLNYGMNSLVDQLINLLENSCYKSKVMVSKR